MLGRVERAQPHRVVDMRRHGRASWLESPNARARLLRRGDVAARGAGDGGERGDQLAVRSGAGAVGQIDRVFEPGAQIAAELGGARVQRPDFLAADGGDAPARAGDDQPQQDRQQLRVRGHPGFDAHDEIVFGRPRVAAVAGDRRRCADDAGVETFELRRRSRSRSSPRETRRSSRRDCRTASAATPSRRRRGSSDS